MTVAGSVEDFDSARNNQLAEAIAMTSGVSPLQVQVSVGASSVSLNITISTRSSGHSTAIYTHLYPLLVTTSIAYSLLNLTVLPPVTMEMLVVLVPPLPNPPPYPPYAPMDSSRQGQALSNAASDNFLGDAASIPLLMITASMLTASIAALAALANHHRWMKSAPSVALLHHGRVKLQRARIGPTPSAVHPHQVVESDNGAIEPHEDGRGSLICSAPEPTEEAHYDQKLDMADALALSTPSHRSQSPSGGIDEDPDGGNPGLACPLRYDAADCDWTSVSSTAQHGSARHPMTMEARCVL